MQDPHPETWTPISPSGLTCQLPFLSACAPAKQECSVFTNTSYTFSSYPKSCPPLGMPSGLSLFTESLPSSFKIQLNCFIIIKVCALFPLMACTDGNDWVLIIIMVSPPTVPHTTCKGTFSLQMLNKYLLNKCYQKKFSSSFTCVHYFFPTWL